MAKQVEKGRSASAGRPSLISPDGSEAFSGLYQRRVELERQLEEVRFDLLEAGRAYVEAGGDPDDLIVSRGERILAAKGKPQQKKVVRLADKRSERVSFEDFCTYTKDGIPTFSPPLLGAYIIGETPAAAGGERLGMTTRSGPGVMA